MFILLQTRFTRAALRFLSDGDACLARRLHILAASGALQNRPHDRRLFQE